MKVIRNLPQTRSLPDLALTIGNFDGVHLGHKKLILEVKKIAAEKKLASAILTFEPHPSSFFNPRKPQDFRLSSLAQKLKIFREEKIDYVFLLPFNQKFSEISAENFTAKIICEAMRCKHLVIGHDFVFGKNREGNFSLLEKLAKELNFGLSEISALKNGAEIFSSSLIRKLIWQGEIAAANKILGKNFSVCGMVKEGKKLASQLGFPTMNLAAKPHIIKPKKGVYKTQTFIPSLQKTFPSITNFGAKPTVDESAKEELFETYIPNLSGNFYGEKISVELLNFLRDEKRFSSLDELRRQIEEDVKKI